MADYEIERRSFLRNAAQGLLAIPVAAACGTYHHPNSTLAAAPGAPTPAAPKPGVTLSVRDFGAKGDGATKDTAAIQQAIDRCWALGGGEALVPAGNYLTGAIALKSNTILRLEKDAAIMGTPDFADYPVTQVRWEGKWIPGRVGLIYAIDANRIGVIGPGKIVGNPALGGRPNASNPLRHPALIEPINCNDVRFEDFSTSYNLMWSLHATYCENVSIKNLIIRSTGGNGDGIDIDSCKHVRIDGCDIATGDDCISIKSGRGMEAYRRSAADQDKLIAQLRENHIHVVRCKIRPVAQDIDFAKRLYAAGIKIDMVLTPAYPPNTPVRAAQPTAFPDMYALPKLSDASPELSKQSFEALLGQLDANGIKVAGFEMYNEINWTAFNGDFPLPGEGKTFDLQDLSRDPEAEQVAKGFLQYLKVLAALKEVRDRSSVNSHAPIILAGLANLSGSALHPKAREDSVSVNATIQFMRQHGSDDLVDAYGVHFYPTGRLASGDPAPSGEIHCVGVRQAQALLDHGMGLQ